MRSLEERIDSLLLREGVPGLSLAWVTRHGRRMSVQRGQAVRSPVRQVDAGTALHLFSGTKLYTATALMLLLERGELALDQPVTRYLPELKLRFSVTLRQLASHSSGLADTLRAFLAVHSADEPGPSTGEALSRYDVSHGRAPGVVAQYRNVNYALLGEVISRVAAKPYESFVTEAVLEPLGAALRFSAGGAQVATGYQPRYSLMRLVLPFLLPQSNRLFGPPSGRFVPLHPFDLDTAAIGGLSGSAESFLSLLEEMLSPQDGLLTAQSKREMWTLQSQGAAGIMSRVGVGVGWKKGQGPRG